MREAKPFVQNAHLDILIKTVALALSSMRRGTGFGRVSLMALDRTFVALTPERLAKMIMNARRRAVYAAPGLSLEVATALINVRDRLGAEAVAAVIDVSEGVLRLGYGVADALGTLREKNLPVRHSEGLRISFIVVDDQGFIFALPPLLVEDSSNGDDHPNAVRASRGQIERLVGAILPPAPTMTAQTPEEVAAVAMQRAEIGRVIAPPTQIERIEEAIKANPVENFDLSRVVNIFSTHFQFFEFEVVGSRVENRTVQLPKELLASIRDKATRERITTAFKLVSSESKVVGSAIGTKAAEIRKRFIPHHPTYGGVILKTSRVRLEAEIAKLEQLIEAHKQTVLKHFDRDAKKSIDALVKAFWRDIARSPPPELIDQGIDQPTTEQAKSYLRRILEAAFPKAADVVRGMRVAPVVKDITWNTLNEPGFVDWLRKQWRDRQDLNQPFELYRAARQAMDANPPRS